MQTFYCSNNQLTVLPTEIGQLTQLQEFYCSNNLLTVLPTEIGQLRYLIHFDYSGNQIEYIPPNLTRILDRIKNHQNVYSDSQNVHNHDIQKCITKSVQNIMNIKPLEFDLSQYIINDTIFTEQTKQLLFEYINDLSIHSVLNITFQELLISDISRIESNIYSDEIKSIMNIEMADSLCKCYTGRMSRLINCLNGFDDLVSINISDKEQIGNIISNIQEQLIKSNNYSVELHKQLVKKELNDRSYDKVLIEKYLNYIEY